MFQHPAHQSVSSFVESNYVAFFRRHSLSLLFHALRKYTKNIDMNESDLRSDVHYLGSSENKA